MERKERREIVDADMEEYEYSKRNFTLKAHGGLDCVIGYHQQMLGSKGALICIS